MTIFHLSFGIKQMYAYTLRYQLHTFQIYIYKVSAYSPVVFNLYHLSKCTIQLLANQMADMVYLLDYK